MLSGDKSEEYGVRFSRFVVLEILAVLQRFRFVLEIRQPYENQVPKLN